MWVASAVPLAVAVCLVSAALRFWVDFIPSIPVAVLICLVFANMNSKRDADISNVLVYYMSAIMHFMAGGVFMTNSLRHEFSVALFVFIVVVNICVLDIAAFNREFDRSTVATFVLMVVCGLTAEPICWILTAVSIHAILLTHQLPATRDDLHEPLKQTPELA